MHAQVFLLRPIIADWALSRAFVGAAFSPETFALALLMFVLFLNEIKSPARRACAVLGF
jgi:hypothetical protein